MKQVTKAELTTALKGKEKTKTYQAVAKLPSSFNGTIPVGIARNIVKMKGVEKSIASAAETVVKNGRSTVATAPTQKARRGTNEY